MPSIRYAAFAVCLLPCFSPLNSAFAQDATVPAVTEESLAPDIETTDPRVEALKARYQEQVKELSDKLITDIEKIGKLSPPSHLEFVAKNRGRLTIRGSLGGGFANHTISVNKRDVEKSPPWHPILDNPPLDAKAAIVIADATMRKWFDDKATSFVLQQISLVPLSPNEGKWYWEAQYGVSQNAWEKELTVAIRMDGEVLTELD